MSEKKNNEVDANKLLAESLDKMLLEAERGDIQSQLAVGMEYYLGVVWEQDGERAFYWFQKAADLGNGEALLHYANCLKATKRDSNAKD